MKKQTKPFEKVEPGEVKFLASEILVNALKGLPTVGGEDDVRDGKVKTVTSLTDDDVKGLVAQSISVAEVFHFEANKRALRLLEIQTEPEPQPNAPTGETADDVADNSGVDSPATADA